MGVSEGQQKGFLLFSWPLDFYGTNQRSGFENDRFLGKTQDEKILGGGFSGLPGCKWRVCDVFSLELRGKFT